VFDPLLRPVKDALLAPLARRVAHIPPVVLTGVGLVTGLSAAWAGYRGWWIAGFALWVLSRIADGLDGLVARLRGDATDLGGLLDLLADHAVYAAIPLGLALNPAAPAGLPIAVAALLAVFYLNAAAWMVPSAILERRDIGARARGEPTTITIPEGLVSGGETVVFYALFFLLPGHQLPLVWTMVALTALTVLQRGLWAVRTFGRDPATADPEPEGTSDPARSPSLPLGGSA